MALVFQVLVLALTAVLWWMARRDLTSKAADARAPAAEDWALLRITVEQLMVELERRAVVAEQRIYEAEQRLRLVEQRLQTAFGRTENMPGVTAAPEASVLSEPARTSAPASEQPAPAAKESGILAAREISSPVVAPSVMPLTAPLLLPGAAIPPLAVDSTPAPAIPLDSQLAAPTLPAASFLAPEEARYLPVYALANSGETDAAEISRQTGLPRGEIELVLNLRARRST